MTYPVIRSGLAIAIVIAVAVGCAGRFALERPEKFPSQRPATAPGTAETGEGTHPITAFLAGARAGDSTYLTLPSSGKLVHVTAHRVYFAASGRYCRLFEVTVSNSLSATTPGLACKRAQERWELQELIVNPNDVNAPQRSLLHQ